MAEEQAMEKIEQNVIYVGKKPMSNYCLAATMMANTNDIIILKARGLTISRAVDISQVIVNQFLQGFKTDKVEVGTETYDQDGRKRNVSTIAITLKKVK